jgi:hypothetical protein
MAFDSLGRSISNVVDERLSSPLVSSFVLSWSLYNYKFFVILFSKNSVNDTFALISQRFPDGWAVLLHGMFWPGFFAAAYLFVLPYPSQWVFRKWKEHQKKMDDIRYESESQQRLTLEDSRTIRGVVRQREADIDVLNREIEKLKADLKDADKRAAEASDRAAIAEMRDRNEQESNQNAATRVLTRDRDALVELGELTDVAIEESLAGAPRRREVDREDTIEHPRTESPKKFSLDISDEARAEELAYE